MAERIARGKLRQSSLKIYDSRWKRFSSWCSERKISPWHVSVQQLADFLLSLFEEGKLKVSTIEGYKSAISATLKVTGVNFGTDPFLCGLVNSFYTDRPIERNLAPRWDLSVVLSALTKSPFEPRDMATIDLSLLTYKTVFLLSLATGARRGEIHALDRSLLRWSSDGKDVFLRPRVGFVSKTQVARDPSTALTGFWVKSLSATMDRSEPDRSLCPVRALRYYIARTESSRAGRKPLFLPLRATESGTLSPNTISAWIRKTISLAYQVAGKDAELARLHSLRAHETRALSSSWDALRNTSMKDIMDACRWRSHNTFTSFYLRDLVEVEDRLLALKCFPTAASNRF